ncbi:B-cell receptor CD22-like, partial [Haliotis cracherodii]|uniref:B-cell receptor CD22-like n=1 Tax=Haliotis cracherodii TaxID=6455 RepID=UPI0039ECAB51
SAALQIHLEPTGSVLNVLLGQVISVVCVVDYCNSSVTSFRWAHNGRSYSGQTFSKTAAKSDAGTLECRVGNVRASTRISVLYPPVVHLEPRNDTLDVTVGEDLRVVCVVETANPGVNTFRWSHNGQTSTGSTFLKRSITLSDRGKLTCTADNGHMMTPGQAVAHVNVQSALHIHLEPTGSVLNVLLGQVISVVCVVDSFNSPATSFRWTHNGGSYSGQTFSKTVTSKSDSGTLECSAGNVRASTQIRILYPPVVQLDPSNDTLDVSVGEDLRVECVVDDANPGVHTFRWYHNGQTSTGSIFLKRNITRSDGGKLTCTADNGHMMTPGQAVAYVNVQLEVSLIGSDDTEYKNQLTAIVTGSVGMVTIIILIIVIIHLRRSLHAAKLGHKRNERPNRTEQANRARHQQSYETMETSGAGAEDTYCRFQMTPLRDNDPDQTNRNLGFAEEEEDVQEKCGPVKDAYYGNIQLELSENIRQQRGKEMEMRKAEGQEYDAEPIYQNTRGSNQLAK